VHPSHRYQKYCELQSRRANADSKGAGREIPEELAQKTDKINEFPNEMWRKFGEAGFLGPTADEEYGGLGMGYQAHCVILEELSRASGRTHISKHLGR
jgi:alkylation response protein AidB-like acyl-CoA dehydrogenase